MDTPAGQLQRAREQARARLADGYAHDLIDQDVLDQRMDDVERAGTIAELDRLTADVTPVASVALVPAAAAARLRVVFGALDRTGAWTVAPRTHVRVVLGSATLDLRQAVLQPGPIELELHIILGSLDLIIPPGWQIENECGAILGSVEQHSAAAPPSAAPRQVLRLTGRVTLASLTIHERLPGEGAWGAHKRRKRERKALAQRSSRALRD